MFNIPTRLKRQAGYIMLEAALALPVAAGIMTYYLAEQRDRLTEDMAKIHGQHMRQIAAATNAYVTNHYDALTKPSLGKITKKDGSLVADILNPTIQDLIDLGLLADSPSISKPFYGGGYRIILTRGTGGDLGQVNGFVITTAPVAPGGEVSSKTIGRALEEIGFNGLATGLGGNPDNFLSSVGGKLGFDLNNSLVFPSPPAAAKGLMAVRVGTGSCTTDSGLACDVFLRRDGTRHMTGDLKMGSDDDHNEPDPGLGIIGNNSISHVNLIRAATIHMEKSPKCQDNHATNPNQHCGGAIKTGFLKSTGNVDVYGNLYLGNPDTKTQFRLGEIADTIDTTIYDPTCPTNYVVVGIKKCKVPIYQNTGSGSVGEDGGYFNVYNNSEITVECTAVCGRIVPDWVPDKPPVVTP